MSSSWTYRESGKSSETDRRQWRGCGSTDNTSQKALTSRHPLPPPRAGGNDGFSIFEPASRLRCLPQDHAGLPSAHSSRSRRVHHGVSQSGGNVFDQCVMLECHSRRVWWSYGLVDVFCCAESSSWFSCSLASCHFTSTCRRITRCLWIRRAAKSCRSTSMLLSTVCPVPSSVLTRWISGRACFNSFLDMLTTIIVSVAHGTCNKIHT